jgi:hydrogenase expression/formation protein HypC
MCLGIPGEIVELLPDRPDLARVEVSGVRRAVNIGLLEGERVGPGDWVLIHVGFALSRIDEAEARAALEFLEGIGAAYDEEIAALHDSVIDGPVMEGPVVEGPVLKGPAADGPVADGPVSDDRGTG